MPRYFFHVAGRDDDGTELADDSAARQAAHETFGAMIREGSVPDGASMEVVDQAGRRVTVLRLSIEG